MAQPIKSVLDAVNSMPSIPKAVQEVMQLVNKDDTSISELADAVAQDPVLSAKVLRLANSAYFGMQRTVDTIESAAILVGMDAIRTMVLASGLMGSFDSIKGLNISRFWSISLLSAYIAKDIAGRFGFDSNRAYTAALMHGIGVLAIHMADPETAQQIHSKCSDACPYDRADLEMSILGFHHGHVGAEIASNWRLPDLIGESIRYYPHPAEKQVDSLATIIHLAVALAIDITDNLPESAWNQNVDAALEKQLGLTLALLPELRPRFRKNREFVQMLVTGH